MSPSANELGAKKGDILWRRIPIREMGPIQALSFAIDPRGTKIAKVTEHYEVISTEQPGEQPGEQPQVRKVILLSIYFPGVGPDCNITEWSATTGLWDGLTLYEKRIDIRR